MGPNSHPPESAGIIMQTFEVGVLPQSKFFFFSPTEKTQKLFYHQTMCGHFFCTDEYYIKRETFRPLLLVYVCNGNFNLELGDRSYTAGPGQVLFFDCRQPHHYYAEDSLEFFFVHFDGPQAHELCAYINETSGVQIDNPNNAKIGQLMHEMIEFYEAGNAESVLAGSNRIYRLLSLLENPHSSSRVRKNDDSLTRVIAYIRSNIGKKMSLHQLAGIAGLSDYYFSHLFKEMTGLSPSNFVIYSRIDHAKSLLLTTDLSVSEISAQVGYPNSSNLITLFTQRVGCSPIQFRKQNGIHTGITASTPAFSKTAHSPQQQ